MEEEKKKELALGGYRALDLAEDFKAICGKILGDLGVDVIKIEKPGGDSSRRIGPFYKDNPCPDKSLFWYAYNANKRSITLNLECEDGKEVFKKLVESADFLIESYPPGFMNRLGLSFEILSQLNPKLIMISISPFGQTGPYKDHKATDIISMAMGGMIYMCGDADRPPVTISYPQAGLHGAMEGVVGALVALNSREQTGRGQHVDVSIQASLIPILSNAPAQWKLNNVILKRAGPYRAGLFSGAKVRVIWKCRDGFISYSLTGGTGSIRSNRALADWIESEGMASEFLQEVDWDKFDMATVTQNTLGKIEESLEPFFMAHTKIELYDGALKRRIMLYPVSTFRDLMNDTQLKARGFWVQVDHPELGCPITYPGPFAKFTETPCQLRYRAPLIGEHNREIYNGELGISIGRLIFMMEGGAI